MSADESPLVASPSQTVGPFFRVGPGKTNRLGRMVEADAPGEHISLRVRVVDGHGQPVDDSLVELWQRDVGFGRLGTEADGSCVFDTVRPGSAGATEREGAAHIDLCVFARGLLRHLYTRVYFGGDPALQRDPILALVPADRRGTLLAQRTDGGTWEFVIRLQGDRETVFFDL
jgi:protocatechuate 3,4-dioxygenase alpha subunit